MVQRGTRAPEPVKILKLLFSGRVRCAVCKRERDFQQSDPAVVVVCGTTVADMPGVLSEDVKRASNRTNRPAEVVPV